MRENVDNEQRLKNLVDSCLTSLIETLPSQALNGALFHIKMCITDVTSDLSYQHLSEEKREAICRPLYDKKAKIEKLINLLNESISLICQNALPGIISEEFTHRSLKRLTPLLKQLPEISPLSLLRFLNDEECINKIHATIIGRRVGYLIEYLHPEENSLSQLQQELRKMTVYRVRRNVIEGLFDNMMSSKTSKWISQAQEKVLLFLQSEFIHALSCEMEMVNYNQIRGFLEEFKTHRVLKPLPSRGFWERRNRLAQEEFTLLMENIDVSQTIHSSEMPPLYDVNSPIEVDIIGEIAKTLITLSAFEIENSKEVIDEFKVLEKTFAYISSVFFKPYPVMQEMLDDPQGYSFIREKIEGITQTVQQRDVIANLYESAKRQSIKHIRQLKQFLFPLYLCILEKELDALVIDDDNDVYRYSHSRLNTAMETMLWQDSKEDPLLASFPDKALSLLRRKLL